jgi:uncharacterized membrane protein
MSRLLNLIKGAPGHPSHPPLTDASIGAYTVGTAMLVLGAAGVESRQMAYGGLLALSGGLLLAVPTALTGLIDWLQMEPGSEARRTATVHLLAMVSATIVFAVAWLAQRPGYLDGTVATGGWIAAAIAEALLAIGGYVGGTIVFHYGHRVLSARDTPMAQALRPSASTRGTDDGAPGAAPFVSSTPRTKENV